MNLSGYGHMRYGHLNFISLRKFSSNNLLHGLSKLDANTMTCETCFRGKQSILVFASNTPKR